MLSQPVKDLIGKRFGRTISTPDVCFELAVHMITLTHNPVTAERLKEILGFQISESRISTEEYDMLARYIGYHDWSQVPREIHQEASPDNHYHVEKKLWRNRYLRSRFLATWGILLLGGIILAIYLSTRGH